MNCVETNNVLSQIRIFPSKTEQAQYNIYHTHIDHQFFVRRVLLVCDPILERIVVDRRNVPCSNLMKEEEPFSTNTIWDSRDAIII
jgi:hypothetical protein